MNSQRKRRKRQQIRERDGDCCHWCNRYLWEYEMTLDHLTPLRWGGDHSNNNLVIACFRCNNFRGDSFSPPSYLGFV
ncbi:HNH endonuclease [Nostoc sp. LEGE 06077]|uniref:HNH endonuclease n=1 Tax=Nostoc sp. LEGE 06077 TaxID=915325 RepID=UPI001880609E|nr:HNH endonuclease [Nostoc sp. LEGE 06077]MBE9205536.1 HNH endonuclease [Nostoc sp. LEGE 06077]